MSDSDIVQEFLAESYENLDRLDCDLVGLEKNPKERDALAGVFRTIHTIKGTCGFLAFNKPERVAHVGENLLTLLRDGQLTLNPEITTGLLGMVDAVRQMLKEIASTGNDGQEEYVQLRETLTRLQNSSIEKSNAAAPSPPAPTVSAIISPAIAAPASPEQQPKASATAVARESAPAVQPVLETKPRETAP